MSDPHSRAGARSARRTAGDRQSAQAGRVVSGRTPDDRAEAQGARRRDRRAASAQATRFASMSSEATCSSIGSRRTARTRQINSCSRSCPRSASTAFTSLEGVQRDELLAVAEFLWQYTESGESMSAQLAARNVQHISLGRLMPLDTRWRSPQWADAPTGPLDPDYAESISRWRSRRWRTPPRASRSTSSPCATWCSC